FRMLCGPFFGERVHVQILRPPAAPVEGRRPRDAFVEHVLDHSLDRREAGARGDEHQRLVGILAQEECAQRPFEAQDVALLHLGKDVVGELPAGDVAHVQFDELASCGALPMEKLRREPSFSRKSTYCPARKTSFSLAGSLICSSMASSDSRSSFCTRQGSFLIWISLAAPMVRASSTRSERAFAW